MIFIIVIVMMIQEIFQCVDGDGDVNATMIMMVNGYEDHEYDDDMMAMMMMKQMMMMMMMHVLHMMMVCQSDFKCEMNLLQQIALQYCSTQRRGVVG